jgi:hypothetical protein
MKGFKGSFADAASSAKVQGYAFCHLRADNPIHFIFNRLLLPKSHNNFATLLKIFAVLADVQSLVACSLQKVRGKDDGLYLSMVFLFLSLTLWIDIDTMKRVGIILLFYL